MILLSECSFNTTSKILTFEGASGFPKTLYVKSEKTGRVVEFVRNESKAIAMEFWDGELMEYIPSPGQDNCGVKTLVVR